MLINTSQRRPNRERVRQLKEALRLALNLSDDAAVTVTELTCLEEGCPPIETVVALLRPDRPPLQHKLHKSSVDVDADDLTAVCKAWGFNVQTPLHELLPEEA
ncbi:MAG: nitrate reductase [Pseudomonadota bacterium]